MAGKSWAEHFRRQEAAPKSGGEPPAPKGGGLGSMFEFVGRWQVLVAAIAAATSLWFGFEDREQKRLTINQDALKFVRDPALIERFWADPPNTLNEIEASYPRHAFCATLGYLLAEVSRADLRRSLPSATGPDRGATLNSARSAIDEEVTRIAKEAALPICYLRELGVATASQAVPVDSGSRGGEFAGGTAGGAAGGAGGGTGGGPGTPEMCRDVAPAESCAAIAAPTSWLDRRLLPHECLLVLDAYGENACVVESGVRRQLLVAEQQREEERRLASAEAAAVTARPALPIPPAGAEPAPTQPEESTSASEQPAEPGTAPAGPAACDGGSPAVFTQYPTGNQGAARAVAEALAAAGWSMTPLDAVDAVPQRGEVRFYYPEQRSCAQALAEDAARALRRAGVETPGLGVISLAKAYRNLPRGRIELWLPAS